MDTIRARSGRFLAADVRGLHDLCDLSDFHAHSLVLPWLRNWQGDSQFPYADKVFGRPDCWRRGVGALSMTNLWPTALIF